ncbi:MAG: M81 family metallopeptidase [Pseudomonadota bacterium]
MRIFAGSLQTETNTFSPIRAGDAAFEELSYPAGTHPEEPSLYTYPLWVAREVCAEHGWTLHEGFCGGAHPAGPINAQTWKRLSDTLISDLVTAGDVDIVLLGLHGAMVADGCEDCEGEILARIRSLVGPKAVIGATLDPHCHLSERMLENADLLIPFKEYPHTDGEARARELVDLAIKTQRGEINPVIVTHDCRMMDMFFTPNEPTASLVRLQEDMEQRSGVLVASLIHGFPWGDVADYGTKTLVITDGDQDLAAATAQELGDATCALRGQTMTKLITVEEAVEKAHVARDVPLVLADFADNPGAGCPSDTTHLIGALIESGLTEACAGFIHDPVAASIAKAAGEGAMIDLRVGGKACALSGDPMDLHVEVLKVTDDAIYDIIVMKIPLGDVAAIRVNGSFDIMLTSKRSQCFSPTAFSNFGIDVEQKQLFVVKSMQHFTAGFAMMEKEVAYVDSPGVASLDLKALPFRNIDRSIWPFTEDN